VSVVCDLHNHSCLSPCASLDMSPSLLARAAAGQGIDIVALTDHNAALNAPAFALCARREGLSALYGMEACSVEEVHVLCLFSDPDAALDFGRFLGGHTPDYPYDPEILGDQAVVDADDYVVDLPERWLGGALDLAYGELCDQALAHGALVIPAHVDRPMFGVLTQLGFLPDGPYAAIEAVRPLPEGTARGYPVISGSDAHYPEHIGRRPFRLDTGPDWKRADGSVDLSVLARALADGKARPYWMERPA